ncbi:hypothetical protein FRB94_007058 [Tulasnella sp. JGI-2019a]|nr:hypothetical protein FRB94_007058 [Tulasnella sp. JGI-2019a]KAG9016969.1 hypothetical protein FRB93_009499 [Tulasnella sp. JGI-2019a]KAG9040134.1 hypothetical protein FRB95_000063 [Tulasnella sp. JGI-2019a]
MSLLITQRFARQCLVLSPLRSRLLSLDASSAPQTIQTGETTGAHSLPYFVPRSTDGTALPIYQDQRQVLGQLTVIKHVRGDLNALAKDIQTELLPHLGTASATITQARSGSRRPRKQVYPVTVCERKRQVILRGRWRRVVNDWFLSKGF